MDNWPPSYQIRHSKRAKTMQLRVLQGYGLEVILPFGARESVVPSFIEASRRWIEQHLNAQTTELVLTPQLDLQAIDECWQIDYEQSDDLMRLRAGDNHILHISGDPSRIDASQELLKRWVLRYAKIVMPKIFSEVAAETGFSYNRLTIRGQKTRWGSCTVNDDINLNFKLLFLPKNLMRHVMIHELCHTREHNHSRRFWQLVSQFDENWRQNDAMLNKVQQHIPSWIY